VGDACGGFNFKKAPGCAIELFTDHPLHIAAGSMPAQNGFSLGAAFVTERNTKNWRIARVWMRWARSADRGAPAGI
jgi:hypothetical protein